MSSLHPPTGQESKRQRKTAEGIPLSTQVSTGESHLPRSSPGSGMVQPFQVPSSGWLQGGSVPFTCKFLWKWNLSKESLHKLHGKLLSQLWPSLSAPPFSSLTHGWATGERLQDKQIIEYHVPRATQLHSQTSPAQAVHLIHTGRRLFQLMPR